MCAHQNHHFRYEIVNGKKLLADSHSLHVTTGMSTGIEIDDFCNRLLDTVNDYLISKGHKPVNRDFRKNVVVNIRNGVPKLLGWSILFFKDTRVYNLAIGNNPDGSSRNKEEISPVSWKSHPPNVNNDDLLVKIPHLYSEKGSCVPVIRPYYIEESSSAGFVRGGLIIFRIPDFITEDNVRDIFRIYSNHPDYPEISSFVSNGYKAYKVRYLTNEEALFARAMQMMTYFQDVQDPTRIWNVKVQREFKSSFKRR